MKTRKPTDAQNHSALGASAAGGGAALAGPPPELRRRLLVIAFAWIGILGASLLLTGLPRVEPLYLVYALATVLLILAQLYFLDAIFRKGRHGLLLGWKKLTGYTLPIYYFLHALPRVRWQNEGLISSGRGSFIFILTLLATAAGSLLFFFLSRPKTQVAFGVIDEEELSDPALRKQRAKERRKRGFLFGILEWVDALAWAAIAVLIVNIFLFQLYVVPSESMVPAFLIGDRPFTLKLASGPRVPLTEWRLPFLRLPQRGDIVTIANPRYPENHRVDLKKYISQLVYMITVTGINLDATLPDGTPKADPLVKRVVGEPGEKLMMVDDRLYRKTAAAPDWAPVEEPWANVDLWKYSEELRSRIQSMPVDAAMRQLLMVWDAKKAESDPKALGAEIAGLLESIESSLALIKPAQLQGFTDKELSRADSSLRERLAEALASSEAGRNPFTALGFGAEDLSLAVAAASSQTVRIDLAEYAQAGVSAAAQTAKNAYERGSRVLNLLAKRNLLSRIDRDLAIIAQGGKIDAFGADPGRGRLLAEARELYLYVQGFYDARNFPEFPEGEAYLARDEYFAMGDNRYNSLDFRFSTEQRERALDPADTESIRYASMLEPFSLRLKFIEGYALFRLWPLSRFGAIR